MMPGQWSVIFKRYAFKLKYFLTKFFTQKVTQASALLSGSSIFLFAGYGSDAPIQRIDLEGQEILGSKVIGYQPEEGVEYPVLYETTFDRCV